MVEKNVLLCFVKIVNFSGVHLALSEYSQKTRFNPNTSKKYRLSFEDMSLETLDT